MSSPSASCDPLDGAIPSLLDITISDIADGLDQGRFKCVDLVEAYLARTAEINGEFRPIIQMNPDAILIAKNLDAEMESKGRRGPLHGVPVYVKDNIATHDKLDGSAGSVALSGSRPPREAAVIQKLRAAGAVILGKANLSEWSNMRSWKASGGWSPRGGQTLGVYCEQQSPSGSSSGSAVATALGICLGALGSETEGSLVSPAEKSNVVTIKPTVGLVSRDGIIPISHRQDTAGPIARTVTDAAHILSAISGRDPHDRLTDNMPFKDVPDYASACSTTSLCGLRIGVPRNAFEEILESQGELASGLSILPAVMETFDAALRRLGMAGATVVENANFSGLDEYLASDPSLREVVVLTDFQNDIKRYLGELKINPNNLVDLRGLVDFTKSTPGEAFPQVGLEVFEKALGTKGPTDPAYEEALALGNQFSGDGGILGALERWNLDALVVPTTPWVSVRAAAIGGLPIVGVPLGFYPQDTKTVTQEGGKLVEVGPNVPFCLTIYGKAFSEETLIRIAFAHEQLSGARKQRQPIKLPTTELGASRSCK